MSKSCLLCGVGGQGTVLASRLIAASAMEKGQMARTAETIGMAQRGGCVVSHVRIGEQIASPLIPKGKADVLIGFEPAEAVRNLCYLKKGGIVIVNKKAIAPVTASLSEAVYTGDEMLAYLQKHVKRLILVDGDAICVSCGSLKVLNIVLLGAAVATGELGVSLPEVEQAIHSKVNKKFHEMNKKALAAGAALIGSGQTT
ncbi:MAG: indolepyruvate oxidoreductase subunit beta [Lachnospiraceae bacterium]